jgi:hypothetical protein
MVASEAVRLSLNSTSRFFRYYEIDGWHWWIPVRQEPELRRSCAGMTLLFHHYCIVFICESILCHAALDAASSDFSVHQENNLLLRRPRRF